MDNIYKIYKGQKYYKFFLGDMFELIDAFIENEVKNISYNNDKRTLYFTMKANYTLNNLQLTKTMRIGNLTNYFLEGVYLDELIKEIIKKMKNYTRNLIENNVDEIMIRLGQKEIR